jgi:hypothetical protein
MKMSEINVQKSKYFKIVDLEKATGLPWGKSNLTVEVERASIGEYPAEDGKEPEQSFLLEFIGHEKPMGMNLTNRKTIQGIVGDVEWDTPALAGLELQVYAEYTSMGPGLRVRFQHAEPPAVGDETHRTAGEDRDADAPPF